MAFLVVCDWRGGASHVAFRKVASVVSIEAHCPLGSSAPTSAMKYHK
jgi:hypothetical protein